VCNMNGIIFFFVSCHPGANVMGLTLKNVGIQNVRK
jgi:hypothetical protein